VRHARALGRWIGCAVLASGAACIAPREDARVPDGGEPGFQDPGVIPEAAPEPGEDAGTDPGHLAPPQGVPVATVESGDGSPTPEDASTETPRIFWATLGRRGVDRLLLRAGCAPLAGLPAQRNETRDALERQAVSDLERGLVDAVGVDLLAGRLRSVLSKPVGVGDDLWCSAARAVGRAHLTRYTTLLVEALPEGDPGESRSGTRPEPAVWARAAAAREALHELFGIWVPTRAAARMRIGALREFEVPAVYLSGLAEAEQRGRGFLRGWLSNEPGRATELLADPDPLDRAIAARTLGAAVLAGRVERGPVLTSLFARLAVEFDPRPHFELLDALAGILEHDPPTGPEVLRLRAHLASIHGGDRALGAARALARLPFSLDPADREASDAGMDLAGGLRLLDALLAGVTSAPDLDPDPVLECLFSLSALSDRAEGAGLGDVLRASPAHDSVLALLVGDHADAERAPSRSLPVDLANAAASTFAPFARPSDAGSVIAVLNDPRTAASLAHALLGVLRRVLFAIDPVADARDGKGPVVRAILEEVARLSGSASPDLRRRALDLFAEERLDPTLAALRPGFFDFLAERFRSEQVPDLRRRLVTLLTRRARPALLPSLLSAPAFEELAADGSSVLDLTSLCLALAQGRAGPTLAAARRIASSGSGQGAFLRLRQALRLASSLPPAEARRLPPADHRLVCLWAWCLHLGGDPLLELSRSPDASGEIPASFLARLLELHLPACTAAPPGAAAFSPALAASLRAVLLAKLALVPGGDESPRPQGSDGGTQDPATAAPTLRRPTTAEVETAFAEALTAAATLRDLGSLLHRDRARFRAALGDRAGALADYRPLADAGALELPDLRRALALLDPPAEGPIPASLADELFRRTRAIVTSSTWQLEPKPLRLADLDLLTRAALALGPDAVAGALACLDAPAAADLASPPDPPSSVVPGTPDLESLRTRLLSTLQGAGSQNNPASSSPGG